MATVIVNIGRNQPGSNSPISAEQWEDYKGDLRVLCHKYLTTIYTMAEGTGYWEGETEDSYVVVGEWPTGLRPHEAVEFTDEFLTALGALRVTYGQEGIAVTVGQTHLLGVDD